MIRAVGRAQGRVRDALLPPTRGVWGITSRKFKFQMESHAFWSVKSALLQEIIIGEQRAGGCDTRRWQWDGQADRQDD